MNMRRRIKYSYICALFLLFISFIPSKLCGIHESIPSPLASHFKKQYTDDLDGLLKRRHVRILVPFNKTNFYLSGATFYGFEYSLLKDYEKFLNRNIRSRDLQVVLEFIPVTRDQLIPGIVEGFGDIAAAGLTITPERLKEVDFTRPYLRGIDEVIVIHEKVRGVKALEDLSGRDVFLRKSSSYYESLLALNRKFAAKRKPLVRIIEADENLETEDILELVNSGAVGITVADSHIAGIWSRVFKNLRVLDHLKIRTGGKIAWMIRKNNPELKRSLNDYIKTIRKGTLLGNIYFNRYFKNTRWIKDPLGEKEKRTLERYRELFKKYATQYGFDWMLIMALAFQESALNNNKKSEAGAVGIMQVRPSTASDKKIGIKNVHLLENNIHAGTKYLAFLRDRYFTDRDISERDRIRFTLAAYNAGPSRIQQVRKRSTGMGLDPNRWFRNTELAALKYIGQETVRYVSNINKYYVIFRLAVERKK